MKGERKRGMVRVEKSDASQIIPNPSHLGLTKQNQRSSQASELFPITNYSNFSNRTFAYYCSEAL